MKKLFFLVLTVSVFLNVNQAQAQRYLPGQKGLQITGGMVDGWYFNDDKETGYYFGAALSTYTKNGNRWVVGAEFMNKDFKYREVTVPVAQFTGEAGYYIKLLSDRRKTFFLSFGLSAALGYETTNWGDKKLYDGAIITHDDKFIYGGAVTLELETFLTDRIILLINGRERGLFGGNIGKFHTQFGVGLKFIIN